ncbi:MAG TPA: SDR family NAD(P)-dependent oxidoreductase, partial [Candidatus Limnocylindria bacterium]|nr:SDR family NAD(P)-dependent oxidoreductase [Candidatus Limnocylindria bacterium]
MSDFVRHVLGEVQAKRLTRDQGLALLREFRDAKAPVAKISSATISNPRPEAKSETVVRWIPLWNAVRPVSSEMRADGPKLVVVSNAGESTMADAWFPSARQFSIGAEESVELLAERLRNGPVFSEVVWLALSELSDGSNAEGPCVTSATAGLRRCFRCVKALIVAGYDRRQLTWTLITRGTHALSAAENVESKHAGLHGFVGSMTREFPEWTCRSLDLPLSGESVTLPSPLPEPEPSASTCIWREGEWHRSTLVKVVESLAGLATPTFAPLREGGVYVIIGGAGGIGAAWTADTIRRFRARVVWLGRRAKDADIQGRLDAAGDQGIFPEYVSVDATDRAALQAACAEIRRRHGAIHGVIHSAIVLSDATVRTMSEAQLLASFTAKAAISASIGEVCAAEPPDFVLFFSSMMSFTRPAGQSNYAAGSVFADAHAAHLRRVLRCPVKVMNWAYWGASGVVASAAYQQRMTQAGLGSIGIEDAVPALEALLAGPVDQMALVKLARPSEASLSAETPESVMIFSGDIRVSPKEPVVPAGRAERVAGLRERRRATRVQELDSRLVRLLWAQLIAGGASGKFQKLAADLEPRLGRWMVETLRMLAEHGLREPSARATEAVNSEWSNWNRDRDFWLGQADTRAHVRFAEAALKALPEILAGRRRATDVLFPNSSMELVEGVYRNNPVADFFNETLGDVLCGHLRDRLTSGDSSPIRILEIGAGTGGTTAGLLPRLQVFGDSIAEYCYTDLSEAFLAHARRTFGPASPFLTYAIFDMSRPLAGQTIAAGQFDVVIATNVLHATPDIRLALRHAKGALKRGGRLLLNEFVEKTAFTHITFGLLDGWWLYSDPALRIPGCPGLTADRWRAVLQGEGFANVTAPVAEAADLGQQIFWAESDGVVRVDAGRPVPAAKTLPAISTANERVDDTGSLRDFLAASLSQSLKMDAAEIDDEASFADYGVDSLTGVRFVRSISQSLSIDLTTTDLFDHPTLQRLTRHVATRHPQALQGRPASSAAPVPEAGTNGVAPASLKPVEPGENDRPPMKAPERVATNEAPPSRTREPIAIVGMSGRYAQADTLGEFWQHLAQGRNLVGKATRWDLPRVLSETLGRNSEWCADGSFLDRIDEFDPTFFNISGTEAVYMDPQQRLFLEESWKALEDAGYAGAGIRGQACGVYVGCNTSDYKEVLGNNLPPQAMWGNSSSVIPARISYYLDLRGPALAVDTACSSSLVAIHLACQGLWAGETAMALAGGVFVQSTPVFYIAANRAGMLSATGQCHTFDARADGFVPGEGVGVVVLKRLADAQRDRDEIHGIIEGSGINQDGATNGVTAPSADSQERLERGVHESFGIRPDDIGMVEAHGTGTRLGDPIEFEALTRAFRHDTARTAFCAIGSVKTNVGHTTAAAGVTGLFKVVLALKHRQIPPSLNFASGNPAIPFERSPFYVNTRLQEWAATPGKPRRAALSAFGFSGTNAHLVIREAPSASRQRLRLEGYPILLTARSQGQLRAIGEALVAHLEGHPEIEMADVSYTLQVGRRHLEHRLGCVVGQGTELVLLLRRWLKGETVPGVLTAVVDRKTVRQEKGRKQLADAQVVKCRSLTGPAEFASALREALEIQVQGHEVDFGPLFAGIGCGRISLPAYPFARESYWAPKSVATPTEAMAQRGLPIHPLVHRNVSTLDQHGFESQFSGDEFFLSDHVVGGQRILPAAAYLEMARAAVEQSVGGARGERQIRLRNIAWYQPLVAGSAATPVRIVLERSSGDVIGFEIFSMDPAGPDARRVHCRGVAEWVAWGGSSGVDRGGIQSQCTQAFLSGEECYAAFRSFGLDYGSGHQSLLALWVGTDAVVAQLELPESVLAGSAAYELHPSLIDGALQTIIGFGNIARSGHAMAGSAASSPVVPFALESVEILRPCPPQVWVITRRKAEGMGYDIDVCDENGGVCVRLNGLVTRTLTAAGAAGAKPAQTLFFVPEWKPQPAGAGAVEETQIAHRRVIFFRPVGGFRAALRSRIPDVRYVAVEGEAHPLAEKILDAASVVLAELQEAGRSGREGLKLVQIVCREETGTPSLLQSVSGMLHTALAEDFQLRAQLIRVPEDDSAEAIIDKLLENGRASSVRQIRYVKEHRSVLEWVESALPIVAGSTAVHPGDVCLITGGIGGLGLKVAQEVARKIGSGVLILVGRRPAGQEIDRLIAASFPETAARVVYRQSDISKREQVDRLVSEVVGEFGTIHGIFHAAGVTRDRLIGGKSMAELETVFAPKVAGQIHLDEATRELSLRFFVLFSAVAGVLGNPGQADYASANSFMDAYAEYREALATGGKRHGRTVTINWPLWSEGGMQVDAAVRQSLRKRFGMVPLSTVAGLQALDRVLASGSRQVLVLHGRPESLRALTGGQFVSPEPMRQPMPTAVPAAVPVRTTVGMAEESADQIVLQLLKERVSAAVNFPPERLDSEAPLERYGLDSLMIMGLTSELEKTFGSLSKTLFFEHQSLKELADYFVSHHRTRVLALRPAPAAAESGRNGSPHSSPVASAAAVELPTMQGELPGRGPASGPEALATRPGDVAIIGLAGRYPKANTLGEFWTNISTGRDCIEEIPAGRWDHSRYYDPTRNTRGKTYAKWGGFIEGVDQFDPGFFNISPREAGAIDPQERLFLECVYDTLEDAGYTRQSLAGDVGVYVGVMYEEYQLYGAEETAAGRPIALPGNPSSIANRVSYFCNFHGPCLAVDTMCSSSLTAIHLACQALRLGECSAAVAGGVNLSVHPNKYLMLAQGNFASSTGRCESFGRGGDGYVPSEGVGAVLLKPLERALADGDQIYGVIRGSAINHGGKTNGYTVPNPKLQAELIAKALHAAGVEPRSVSYIEAHGTGTSLGDPIEIAGLCKAFEGGTSDRQFCAIGSVKSNIGHCESAAGIAGLTKVLLQLRHGLIAPSIHSATLNPNINFAATPFFVPQKLSRWDRSTVRSGDTIRTLPRRAGLSSFGAGGSYAHVLIEEWESLVGAPHSACPELVILSARSELQVLERAGRLLKWLETQDRPASLAEVAHTLQVGREEMSDRVALLVSSLEELRSQLTAVVRGDLLVPGVWRGSVKEAAELLSARQADSDVQLRLERLLSARDLTGIAQLWTGGMRVDWSRLCSGIKPRRISLPTYPFQRQRCWFSNLAPVEGNPAEVSAPPPAPEVPSPKRPSPVEKMEPKAPRISLRPLGPVAASASVPAAGNGVHRATEPVLPAATKSNGTHHGTMALKSREPAMVSTVITATALQRELVASLATALFMKASEIDPDRSFVELGLDSIIGVEWIQGINRKYRTNITATKVYDHPSIRRFAVYLAGELAEQMQPDMGAKTVPSDDSEARAGSVELPPASLQSAEPLLSRQPKPSPSWAEPDETVGDEHYGLVVSSVGSVDQIALRNWVCPPPAKDEVQIRVRASAINFPDTLCVRGLYPTMPQYPFVPGFEVAGVIVEVGPEVTGFNVGDQVIALTGKQMGGHASHVNVPAAGTVRKPAGISFEDACSLPVVFGTVYHAFQVGKLARGEHLLIQTATGGCGLAALQLAHLTGCIPYGTSSRDEKLAILERLGVPHRLNYKTTAFDEEIARLTAGRGVDAVLNMLSGEAIQRGLNCLGASGRYLELAVHGLKTSPKLDLSRLVQNQSVHSIDLRQLSYQGTLDGRAILEEMVALLATGALVPIVSRIYPLSQVREALAYVGEGRHIGKVVISHTRDEMEDCTGRCLDALVRQRLACAAGQFSLRFDAPVPGRAVPPVAEAAVAIIGMSGRFPNSPNPGAFWKNILEGVNCVGEVPASRWALDQYFDPKPRTAGKSYGKWMGVLEGADEFDPLFFNISPAEAEFMDPQQRLFLQSCWTCLEDAGVRPTSLSGSRCGVFVGCGSSDYGQGAGQENWNAHGLMGGAPSILASRISYFLNLKGPSIAIDTACSSSLTAIATACESLRARSCDAALAGGVYVMAGPSMHVMTSQAGMLSRDGKCQPFDARANGFVPGEGVGVVLLKRHADAVRDGDPILGVIRGWGVNQDGKTNGITAPSANSQTELETGVYRTFGIDASTISLVEAHGTGTLLGDPIEVEALVASFRQFTSARAFCALGSVKGNIGHLMPAAGVAGLMKVLLALRQQVLPPTLHFEALNPHIQLEDSAFFVNTEARPWNSSPTVPRRAAVSSFGFSGTNAHLVVEEGRAVGKMAPANPVAAPAVPVLFVLSAKTEARLKACAMEWAEALAPGGYLSTVSLADLAFTVQVGREAMDCRLAVVISSHAELREELQRYLRGDDAFSGSVGVRSRGGSGVELGESEEGRRFLLELGRNARWKPLAKLWVAGEPVDFGAFHPDSGRRVAGLPTYAFARDRYWRG